MSDATDTSADAEPFKVEKLSSRFDTDITLPGSKSITRQLAIAALCDGTTELRGIPACDDSAAMLDCIAALGARDKHQEHITVKGPIDFSDRTISSMRV